MATQTLRLGTRRSLLAQAQSRWVAGELARLFPEISIELVPMATTGDRVQDRPLRDMGGKGLFTKELELALLEGSIDFAVHSFKDVPVTQPLVDVSELVIAAVPEREEVRDVLVVSEPGRAVSLNELPSGARIGTSSLRRRCQLLHRRPDLVIEPVRGNIDTRLRKLREGQLDALVLAAAGLRRTELFDPTTMHVIDLDYLLPAPGQGALAVQCRRGDAGTIRIVQAMNDPVTQRCVEAERAVVRALEGDCSSPIAALGLVHEGWLTLEAAVGRRGGDGPAVRAWVAGVLEESTQAIEEVLEKLRVQGAAQMLSGGQSPSP